MAIATYAPPARNPQPASQVRLGEAIRARRENMGMSLSELSREMGGSPAPSFISKIETGRQKPTLQNVLRFADALSVPRDLFLNLGGYATSSQIREAERQAENLVNEHVPVMTSLPVYDPLHPDADEDRLPRRGRLMRTVEDAFIVDLSGAAHAPYEGEVIVSREREPLADKGVVAVVDGRIGAWTYRDISPTGPYLENGKHEKRAAGFQILGRIIRVTSETDLE